MTPLITMPQPSGPITSPATGTDAALRDAAEALEVRFISEMLKSAGFGEARESFGGGAGEEGFSSFLRDLQAEQIVKAGGFGLAEQIFDSLKSREAGNG